MGALTCLCWAVAYLVRQQDKPELALLKQMLDCLKTQGLLLLMLQQHLT